METAGLGEEAPAPAPRTPYDYFRENAEALIVAIILAVIIRHFTVEAFEIPTGSMANTLYGIHSWLECPNCDTWFNVALASDSSTGKVNVAYRPMRVYRGDCPNASCSLEIHSLSARGRPLSGPGDRVLCTACGTVFLGSPGGFEEIQGLDARPARCPLCHFVYRTVFEAKEQYGGHKILVDKLAFVFGEPKRWDVFVFTFDQWKNYIKRLVGLPGERIDIWDGDIYVNGALERKSRHPYIQDVLWTKISDTDAAERTIDVQPPLRDLEDVRAWPRAPWQEVDARGGRPEGRRDAEWKPDVRRWSVNAAGGRVALEYQRGFENYYSYNLLRPGPGNTSGHPAGIQVGDKKVAFTVLTAGAPAAGAPAAGAGSGASWVGAEVRDGDFAFRLSVPVGAGAEARAVLERIDPATGVAFEPALRVEAAAGIPLRGEARLELENADDRVAARLDGAEFLALEYTSLPPGASPAPDVESPGERPGDHFLRLVVSGIQAELGSIQVHRDMYYIAESTHHPWRGIQLGEGEYLALGDNAPSSQDGRYWGAVPEKNLMGKALLVFWPALPWNFQCKFIK